MQYLQQNNKTKYIYNTMQPDLISCYRTDLVVEDKVQKHFWLQNKNILFMVTKPTNVMANFADESNLTEDSKH